jgi:hypothetical protein
MDKTEKLKTQQDFLRRNKSSQKMLQEQQKSLKKGLLGTTRDFKSIEIIDPTINKKKKKVFLQQRQKGLKLPMMKV